MQIGNSFNTQTMNHINQNKTDTEETLSKIGAIRELSGKDNANLLIANALSSQISTLTQDVQNENESVAMNQIADSSLNSISQSADDLKVLSVSHNNAALNGSQKDALNQEFKATVSAMQEMVNTTQYNGKSLLSAEQGAEVVGLDSLDIENQEGISSFSQDLDTLSSTIGANTNQSLSNIANSLSAITNLANAHSNISEEPMDKKINDLATNQIKLDSSIMAQSHQTEVLQQRVSALLV